MNVSVQITGSPESVAAFLRELGCTPSVLNTSNITFNSETGIKKETEEQCCSESEKSFSNNVHRDVEPSEDILDEVSHNVTFAQVRAALTQRGVRYKAAKGSDVTTAKHFLVRICEEIGGAEPGSGSSGIKPEKYEAVYDFCIHDKEFQE